MSCTDAMLLLVNFIGGRDTNMYTFRIFPECGYSHTIRFHEITDRLVQDKKNNLVRFHALYILAACGSTASSKRFGTQLSLNDLQTGPCSLIMLMVLAVNIVSNHC